MTTMSTTLVSMMLDGAVRAAQLLPLAFSLGAVQPAAAQLPRPEPALAAVHAASSAPAVVVIDADRGQPLPPAARHVAIDVRDGQAVVHTVLTYRNSSAEPMHAVFRLPRPAVITGPGDYVAVLQHEDEDAEDAGCGGPGADTDEIVEAGEDLAHFEHGSVLLAPGESFDVTLTRDAPVLARAQRHRLVLPLTDAAGDAAGSPLTAEVLIQAGQPIRALASATHGGQVIGLGDRLASLQIAVGKPVTSRFLSVDYELEDAEESTPAALAAAR